MINKNPFAGEAAIVLLTILGYLLLRGRQKKGRVVTSEPAPPMLERAVRLKVERLEQAAATQVRRQKQLHMATTAYQTGQLSITTYNELLVEMIISWKVDI